MMSDNSYEKSRWDTIAKMIGDTGINLSELKANLVILLHLNRDTMSAFPGYGRMAAMTKLSRSTLIRAAKGRVLRYFNVVRRRKPGTGHNFSNEYFVIGGPSPESLCVDMVRAKFPDLND